MCEILAPIQAGSCPYVAIFADEPGIALDRLETPEGYIAATIDACNLYPSFDIPPLVSSIKDYMFRHYTYDGQACVYCFVLILPR